MNLKQFMDDMLKGNTTIDDYSIKDLKQLREDCNIQIGYYSWAQDKGDMFKKFLSMSQFLTDEINKKGLI
jgi:hypothetical protein